jgi:hypothetical protein
MLAELAESIKNYLIGLPPERWGLIKPNTVVGNTVDFPIVNTLDPDEIIKCKTRKIFIMPVVPKYDMSVMTGQRSGAPIKHYTKQLVISAIVVTPFTEIAEGDVSSWDEIKKILNLREDVENNIIKNWFGYKLTNVETEEPVDIKLNERVFLCVTDFQYETTNC